MFQAAGAEVYPSKLLDKSSKGRSFVPLVFGSVEYFAAAYGNVLTSVTDWSRKMLLESRLSMQFLFSRFTPAAPWRYNCGAYAESCCPVLACLVRTYDQLQRGSFQ